MPIDPALNQSNKIQEMQNIDNVSKPQTLDSKAVQKLAQSAEAKSVGKLLAEGEKDTTVTTYAIKSMMANAAQSGIDLSSKRLQKRAEEKMQRELAQLEKGENKHEQVTLSSYAANVQKNLKDRRAEDDGQGRFMFKGKGEKSQLAKEFAAAFSRYTSEYNPELQSELKELESRMFKKGFSQRELLDMKKNIKNAMREEVQSQIKNSMLNRELSASDLWTSARYTRMMNGLMSQAQGMYKLGGKDFGGYKDGMSRMLIESMAGARDELKSFIGDELNESIVRGVIKGNQEYMSKFDELQKMIMRTNFNLDDFLGKIETFMDDEGLARVKIPKKKSILDKDADDMDGKGGQGKQFGEEEGQSQDEEEKEMLMDMLRAALLEKALKGGLRNQIKTMFKMREVKKGLMRLGVFTPELIEKVKNEANTLAGMKIMDMLKDAILERSTLMDLKSTEYKLVKRKIKGLIKNAKALGIEIGEETLERLIGESNKKTFDLIKREIEGIDAEIEQKNDKNLLNKREQLMTVMKRIKDETFIPAELPPEEPEGKHEVAEEA